MLIIVMQKKNEVEWRISNATIVVKHLLFVTSSTPSSHSFIYL